MTGRRAFATAATYEIQVRGRLDTRWSHQLGGLEVLPQPEGDSLLVGPVIDQAALYGLLSRMRDLGLVLISVQRMDDDQDDP